MSTLPAERTPASVARGAFLTPEQIALIKSSVLKPRNRAATDDEFKLFLYQCERTRLDPFSRQIYAVFRWDGRAQGEVMNIQASIDGLRLVAERSGKYDGQDGPYWTADGKEWVDVWLDDDNPPKAAKVGVWKAGASQPTFGVAKFSEYAVRDNKGVLTPFWRNMPANQLAKCAEALALRKVFPNETSGLYTTEEMQQADKPTPDPRAGAIESTATEVREPQPEAKPEPTPTPTPEPAPQPTRDPKDTITPAEGEALQTLIAESKTSDSFVRMQLMVLGVEDVGDIETVLPRLTVAQAMHVTEAIRGRLG